MVSMQPPSPDQAITWYYNLVVKNQTPLYGPWSGWRLAGRDLVAHDGTRFSTERLRGLAWHQEMSTRLNTAKARKMAEKRSSRRQTVKVVIVELADWLERRTFGVTSA